MQHFNKHVDMSKKMVITPNGNYPKSNGISSGSSQFPKCFVTIFGYTDRCTIFFNQLWANRYSGEVKMTCAFTYQPLQVPIKMGQNPEAMDA